MLGRSYKLTNTLIILAVMCAVFLAYIPAVHAASQPLVVVEVFKEDKVRLDLGDVTHVTRTLTIQNEINRSIVPGIITLTLQKESPSKLGPISLPFTSSVKAVNVTNVTARLGDGTAISDVKVSEVNDSTVIQYGAWVPIDAGQTLTVILEYDSPDIVEKGLFFNTVQYPFTSSSIPVENAVIEANAGNGHITYSSETPTSNGNPVVWERSQLGMDPWAVSFEYSILPLPMLPINGGMLIWGIILLICLIWVAWTYTRPRKGAKKP